MCTGKARVECGGRAYGGACARSRIAALLGGCALLSMSCVLLRSKYTLNHHGAICYWSIYALAVHCDGRAGCAGCAISVRVLPLLLLLLYLRLFCSRSIHVTLNTEGSEQKALWYGAALQATRGAECAPRPTCLSPQPFILKEGGKGGKGKEKEKRKRSGKKCDRRLT